MGNIVNNDVRVCRICGREYEAYTRKSSGGRRVVLKRGRNTKTCSKRCSKEYAKLIWKTRNRTTKGRKEGNER